MERNREILTSKLVELREGLGEAETARLDQRSPIMAATAEAPPSLRLKSRNGFHILTRG